MTALRLVGKARPVWYNFDFVGISLAIQQNTYFCFTSVVTYRFYIIERFSLDYRNKYFRLILALNSMD